jgi:hypothetical protein
MTQIRVEPTPHRRSPWPWIVGLIVLGLLVWFVVEVFDLITPEAEVGVEEEELIEDREDYVEEDEPALLPRESNR